MDKKLLKFLENAIQDCWDSQKNCAETDVAYLGLDAQIKAYQDVYLHFAGEEFDPTSDRRAEGNSDTVDTPPKLENLDDETSTEDDPDPDDE